MGNDGETSPGPATRPIDDDAPVARVARYSLVVTAGPDAGQRLVSSGDRTVIGTHRSCDLVLTDPTVSRFHAELTLVDGRLLLRDLDSRNGTRVEGLGVVAVRLPPRARLELGGSQVELEVGDATVELPLSTQRRFGSMAGASAVMRRTFALLERAAASDATVLLEGETGTGKEAAAASIHDESARRAGPLVVVDCGAVPATLIESELFGHERGAFTGAVEARVGAFEAAHGGTLFLDEIGELPLELQPKLLRALESREIKRVGATRHQAVAVRVIAATNRDLRVEVNGRRFRADLYYRLAVLEIRLPPLRERAGDIPVLVEHLLGELGASREASAPLRTAETTERLARHPWPGNVRELRNYLERALALETAPPIAPGPAPDAPAVDLTRPLREAREAWTRPHERAYVAGLLEREGGNVAAAARAAGVDRMTFYKLLSKHGIR
jgi:DNA-binding NtrC family response regulator